MAVWPSAAAACARALVATAPAQPAEGRPAFLAPSLGTGQHRCMKLSVRLSDEDVALLDEYVRTSGLPSRSAAVQHAVRLLRRPDLEQDYEAAWAEWDGSGEQTLWDGTAADGRVDAAR